MRWWYGLGLPERASGWRSRAGWASWPGPGWSGTVLADPGHHGETGSRALGSQQSGCQRVGGRSAGLGDAPEAVERIRQPRGRAREVGATQGESGILVQADRVVRRIRHGPGPRGPGQGSCRRSESTRAAFGLLHGMPSRTPSHGVRWLRQARRRWTARRWTSSRWWTSSYRRPRTSARRSSISMSGDFHPLSRPNRL